jgi:hypothetical protein
MFLPFTRSGADRTGLGLGLSISRRSVEVDNVSPSEQAMLEELLIDS